MIAAVEDPSLSRCVIFFMILNILIQFSFPGENSLNVRPESSTNVMIGQLLIALFFLSFSHRHSSFCPSVTLPLLSHSLRYFPNIQISCRAFQGSSHSWPRRPSGGWQGCQAEPIQAIQGIFHWSWEAILEADIGSESCLGQTAEDTEVRQTHSHPYHRTTISENHRRVPFVIFF